MKRPTAPELDIHLPEPLRWAVQPLFRAVLLALAGYKVEVVGKLPKEPSLLAAYPHGEHANHILLPPKDIVYMAAADHWYTNILLQLATALVVDGIPVVREGANIARHNRELAVQADVLNKRKKHLLIYPQGTRRGPAETPYDLQRQLKHGIAFMALHLQKQTIPIGLVYPADFQPAKGKDNAWTNAKRRMVGGGRIVPIVVRIGEPIEPPYDNTKLARELFLSVLARELFNLTR